MYAARKRRLITKSAMIALLLVLVMTTSTLSFTLRGKEVLTGEWLGEEREYIAGELLLRLEPGADSSEVDSLLSAYDAVLTKDFDDLRWGFIEFHDSIDVFQMIDDLTSSPLIENANPNTIYYAARTFPNDIDTVKQWSLYNWGYTNYTPDADIDAPEAWDYETGGSDVLIAILDSGIPINPPGSGVLSHPELNDSTRFFIGPDFYYGDDEPRDLKGHGTHVTGIVAAETNNDLGIAAINWGCKIHVMQVFDDSLPLGDNDALYDAILYAVDSTEAKIINYSGGGGFDYDVRDAVEHAYDNDVLIVACAGNHYGSQHNFVWYPACFAGSGAHGAGYDNVIAVSATNPKDWFSWYSNYGPQVTVAAPGDGIFSTVPNYQNNFGYQNYHWMTGTSQSTPHVTGLAALLFSHFPNLGSPQIRQIIASTSEDLNYETFPGRDDSLGWGRINAYRAITAPRSGTISSDETWSDIALVIGDITVCSGATLTIDPGTTIRFLTNYDSEASGVDTARCEIDVQGTLIAEGTASEPIIFTSTAESPQPQDWYRIRFMNSSTDSACIIKNCHISYAYQGIYCDDASPEISTNVISNCTNGIYCINRASPEINDNRLHDISGYGINCYSDCSPHVASDTLLGKGSADSRGINCWNSSPQIQNCVIENFECGINCCGGNPVISGTQLSNNSEYGIACNISGTPQGDDSCNPCSLMITDNEILGSEYGLRFGTSAEVYVSANIISENQYGIYSDNSPSIVFGNEITENYSAGVYCSGTNLPCLGDLSNSDSTDDGNNDIWDNQVFDVLNEASDTAQAENNWWGPDSLDSSQFSGFVDYIPSREHSSDSTAPAAITDLSINLIKAPSDSGIVLSWSEVTTDVEDKMEFISHYIIYRDTTHDYEPTSSESLAAVPDNIYE